MTREDDGVIRSLAQTDPVQVDTKHRTLTGVVYQHTHREPELTPRGPEPGEHVLYFATPCHDCYRLHYTYYHEYDHTQTRLARYECRPDGEYAWHRTHATIQTITSPTGGDHE
ncbi:hypothetical protein [Halomicrococcus sp. NG-SE-24]|uniref:hypothetical protein n=1 Tax=Halomicrococcus sp. NG-SE-24 TaxID=3436928 RepID=UPI003D960B5F